MQFQMEWAYRVICALIAGTIIGQERQSKSKEAGARTHAIVAVTACLLMVISKYGFAESEKFDAARIAAQVVSGISFLGAGLIFVRNDFIQGLTTAAGIWATAALGLCFGAGMYAIGIIVGAMMYFIQTCYRFIFPTSHLPRSHVSLRLYLTEEGRSSEIFAVLHKAGYSGEEYRIRPAEDGWILDTDIYTFTDLNPRELLEKLEGYEHIRRAELR